MSDSVDHTRQLFAKSGATGTLDCIPAMTARRKYLNYTTPWGVDLARVARAGASSFLIHECGYQPALEGWNHDGVDSPFWRFYHNPRPGCHIVHRGCEIALEPKTCVLIPADTVFDCRAPRRRRACHLWLHFTVARPGPTVLAEPAVVPLNSLLRTLVGTVIATHRQPAGDARDHRLHHQSAALLHAAFACLDAPPLPCMPDDLLQVTDLIHRAPHSDLSNPFLAASAGMSVERFIRIFRTHTGTTPAAYVAAARIRRAEEMLALTKKSIDEIAAKCGFPNRHYFTRVFSKQAGCGPAEFRARQHDKKGT